MKQIRVKLPGRNYPVLVGDHIAAPLRKLLGKQVGSGRLFVFFDAAVFALHGPTVRRDFGLARMVAVEFVVPSDENSKSTRTLNGIYDFLLDEKISRDDFILAVGGGVTSDLAGYAAATTLRGIRWGVVPTTLLSMVDASIGGKTGLNHGRGKNLIGAFWQPALVGCDVNFLMTVSERQLWAGLGEVAKTCGLAGSAATDRLDRFLAQDRLYDRQGLAELVYLSAAHKAKVIARDERDGGVRMTLNYGHTFAHGIENALGYGRLLHGEAVLIGLVAALALGEKVGSPAPSLERYRRLVTDMLSRLPQYRIDPAKVWEAMALDKKRSSRARRYVLLKALGRPFVTDRIDDATARAALHEALEVYRQRGGRHV